jgi:hypothetical protein
MSSSSKQFNVTFAAKDQVPDNPTFVLGKWLFIKSDGAPVLANIRDTSVRLSLPPNTRFVQQLCNGDLLITDEEKTMSVGRVKEEKSKVAFEVKDQVTFPPELQTTLAKIKAENKDYVDTPFTSSDISPDEEKIVFSIKRRLGLPGHNLGSNYLWDRHRNQVFTMGADSSKWHNNRFMSNTLVSIPHDNMLFTLSYNMDKYQYRPYSSFSYHSSYIFFSNYRRLYCTVTPERFSTFSLDVFLFDPKTMQSKKLSQTARGRGFTAADANPVWYGNRLIWRDSYTSLKYCDFNPYLEDAKLPEANYTELYSGSHFDHFQISNNNSVLVMNQDVTDPSMITVTEIPLPANLLAPSLEAADLPIGKGSFKYELLPLVSGYMTHGLYARSQEIDRKISIENTALKKADACIATTISTLEKSNDRKANYKIQFLQNISYRIHNRIYSPTTSYSRCISDSLAEKIEYRCLDSAPDLAPCLVQLKQLDNELLAETHCLPKPS